ncbi:MAG TPA: chemotaxis protein CheW [Solimonas sp.]|nr:chemotaxis protein CheW [Solimonas sp.]
MSAELPAMRDDPFGLLLQIEDRLRAARMDAVAGQAQTWTGLGFRIGGSWLVAPREDVREVIVPPRSTRVPNAQPWLSGLANVRGEMLAIIDLPLFLGLPAPEAARGRRVLVINSKRMPAGVVVDEVAGYRQFAPSEQRAELRAESGAFAPYLLGAFVREGQPWLAFSLHRLAQSEAFRAAAL